MWQLHRDFMDNIFQFHKLKISSMLPNISHNDCCILMKIEKAGGESEEKVKVQISEVARQMNVSVPSISRTLNHLEKDGYVRRYTDSSNRRNTYVCLTSQGKEILEEVDLIMKDFIDTVFLRMGEEKVQMMIDFFKEFYKIAEEEITKRQYSTRII